MVISRTFRSIWIVGDFNLCSIPPEDHVILLPIISHSLHLSFSLKRTVKLKTYNRLRKMAKVRVLYWSTPRFTYPDCVFRHQYSHTNPNSSFQLIAIEPALVSHKLQRHSDEPIKPPQKYTQQAQIAGKHVMRLMYDRVCLFGLLSFYYHNLVLGSSRRFSKWWLVTILQK